MLYIKWESFYLISILNNIWFFVFSFLVLLNYREKYGEDPLPSERGCENLKNEASAIIKKYELENKIDHLIEYVYNIEFGAHILVTWKIYIYFYNVWHIFSNRSDLYAQLSPVCSIVGGVMAQEIIKAASQKHAPLNNLFTFNPITSCGVILNLGY